MLIFTHIECCMCHAMDLLCLLVYIETVHGCVVNGCTQNWRHLNKHLDCNVIGFLCVSVCSSLKVCVCVCVFVCVCVCVYDTCSHFSQTNLIVPPFGIFQMIPRHSIVLDLSSCTNESDVTLPTAIPTTVPPPPPPPDNSPPLCSTLYDMITSTKGGLDCTLSPSCTSVTCELVRDGPLIQLDMLILPQESDFKAHILYQPFYYAASEEWYVSVGSGMREFGADEGSTLRIQANATNTTLTLRVSECE